MNVLSPLLTSLRAFFPWYLAGINLTAFLFYGADKRKAIKGRWRTPEAVLIGLAACGGGLGAWMGMRVFHHKTHKWKFHLLIPLFCILWITVVAYFYML